MTQQCYHCDQSIPVNFQCSLYIQGLEKFFCCYGCHAVTQTLLDFNLSDYYQYRDSPNPRAEQLPENFLQDLARYDQPAYQQQISIMHPEDNSHEILLMIQGIHCAACIWLIEKRLSQITGIKKISVNLTTQRAMILWHESQIKLSKIIEIIYRLGYQALPDLQIEQNKISRQEKKQALIRVGLSGLIMMQVMMFSIALYLGGWSGIEKAHEQFIRWCSLFLTIPVLFIAGRPFFVSAARAIRNRYLNMDVPIVAALVLSFIASIWVTVHGGKEVYYDSICMFIFFLSVSKYLEITARYKLAAPFLYQALMPLTATICHEDGESLISTANIKLGDILLIKPAEIIPADGIIEQGETTVSESMMTGESFPKAKRVGDTVLCGTHNIDQVFKMRVTEIGTQTLLAQILRLVEKASLYKPQIIETTHKIAGYFVGAVLVIAAFTAWFWSRVSWEESFRNVISVLVITCPCALSLAVPSVVTCATYEFMRNGLLIIKNHVLEGMNQITDVVFDKTGTLTLGLLEVTDYQVLSTDPAYNPKEIAYLLEKHSEHPIAHAITKYCQSQAHHRDVSDLKIYINQGVEGSIDGQRFRIGKKSFVKELFVHKTNVPQTEDLKKSCYLGNEFEFLACFTLIDPLRAHARELVDYCKQRGIATHILSGDPSLEPLQIKEQLGIDFVKHNVTPDEKIAYVENLYAQSKKVLMIGDGMNDAPVLKSAHVSIAINSGTALAKTSADAVLLSNALKDIVQGFEVAAKAKQLMIQNLVWAIVYNIVALPMAIVGWIEPYQAALGMSASSLVVVFNSLRLAKNTR